MLHGVGWQLVTDVSEQLIGPIFKNVAVQKDSVLKRIWIRLFSYLVTK